MTNLVGRLSLDLVAAELHTPPQLSAWLAESALEVEDLICTSHDLAAARRVAKAVQAGALATARHRRPPDDAVRLLNRAAALPPLTPRLDPDTRSFSWHRPSVSAAMSEVARDALAMLGDPEQRRRVRTCANPDCERLFYDDSRPGRRRWCSPERCGDQARARAYRIRKTRKK
jgi:predicted RNA-binding Zn ribbon-like protein